jgi:uncharacterized protein (TIGR03435 family)
MSLRGLIQLAYTLPSDLVSGGPGWVDDTRYDVEAKAEGKASQQQRLAMLKTLLAERFKLTFHYVSLFMALKEARGSVSSVLQERSRDRQGASLVTKSPGKSTSPTPVSRRAFFIGMASAARWTKSGP